MNGEIATLHLYEPLPLLSSPLFVPSSLFSLSSLLAVSHSCYSKRQNYSKAESTLKSLSTMYWEESWHDLVKNIILFEFSFYFDVIDYRYYSYRNYYCYIMKF